MATNDENLKKAFRLLHAAFGYGLVESRLWFGADDAQVMADREMGRQSIPREVRAFDYILEALVERLERESPPPPPPPPRRRW